jgi:sulfite reductase alpha subunit-like flavoprotein
MNDIISELEKLEIKSLKGVPKELLPSFQLTPSTTTCTPKVLSIQPSNILNYKYLTKEVLEITLLTDLKFKPGDIIKTTPKQSLETITKLLAHLNIKPGEYSLNHKVIDLIDFLKKKDFSFPKRQLLRTLASSSKNPKHLLYLCSSQGKELLTKLKNLNLLQLLIMFDCIPKIELLLEFLPDLKQRYYSVCYIGENSVSICFNITGICTSWMEKCCIEKEFVQIEYHQQIRPFYLPENIKNEMLMICNGTGISPFIGLLQELESHNRKCRFIYGHRTLEDQLFEKKVKEFITNGTIVEFVNCLSREEAEFKYVQDSLGKFEDSLFDCGIMVCGSGPMGKGVSMKLIELYEASTKCTKMEAILFWQAKRDSGMLKEDLW